MMNKITFVTIIIYYDVVLYGTRQSRTFIAYARSSFLVEQAVDDADESADDDDR